MIRGWTVALATVLLAIAAATAPAESDASAPASPEDVLRAYLRALKAEDYATAYDQISTAMRAGKDKDAWVAETKAFMSFAEVKVFEFEVHDGKIEGDKARVPNRLESQDRFVNALGLTEYELYTLVKEGGAWKVDSQLLLEPAEVPTWFPDAAK